MPKYKSPDGRVFDSMMDAMYEEHCKGTMCFRCKLYTLKNGHGYGCLPLLREFPKRAARMLGYEIIEDELRPDCYQLANKSDSVSKNGKPKCEKCLWKDTVQCETCSNKNGFRRNYSNQEAKSDGGKPRPSLVPPALIRGVDAIREFGTARYGSPDNWRKVEPQRYWDALLRHILAMWEDWKAVDPDSGMPHLWHAACNIAFLMQYMEDGNG